jgi:hypothetical protein
MEFFYHPWYMVAGGLLISSPILIHLINRMRFKRIRWAAMEFLLKSQKRNRRKLIIEQMILLLLRILLVLLAAFLVARFVYGAGTTRGATHVVVLDDTLSLFDKDREGGKETVAYSTAIDQIKELVRNASEASSAQYLKIFRLSDISGEPLLNIRLSDRAQEEVDKKLREGGGMPSLVHVSPLAGLRKGRQVLGDEKTEGQKILHFVSDFRDRDWTTGAEADKLHEEIRGILEAGINLNLIDVAMPVRTARSKAVNHNNNLAILDLKAETRVAIEDTDVEFKVMLMNYGQAKEKSFVEVYINGEKDLARDVMLEDLEPGKIKEHTFTLRFNIRVRPGGAITEKDTPEEREKKRRLEREQFHIRVTISRPNQAEGLVVDNIRDMVIEVRKKVPTLVVDGNRPENRGDGGDLFHLQSFYAASGVYEIEERTLANLEKSDLDLYPSIILLNVGEIPEPIVKKLKAYVENGGSLCYFMGEEVKPDHYNNVLYKNGIFPLLIGDRPYDPLMAAGMVDPDVRKKERERLRQTDPTPKILFPKPDHQLVRRYVPFVSLFRYLSLNVYWQALPRSRWDPDLRRTEPLVVLPNTSSVDKYKTRAVELSHSAQSLTIKLADKEPEFKKYIKLMDGYTRAIRNNLANSELYRLGETFEDMLKNPGVKNDPEKPNMAQLWEQQEMKNLAAEIREFRETVLYGDPLCVARQQGKGRMVAYLTTAGTSMRRGVGEDSVQWNNWGGGEALITPMYPLFLFDMHRYLISEGQAPQRVLGEDVRFTLDVNRYAPQYAWEFTPQPDLSIDGPQKLTPEKEKGPLTKEGNQMTFALTKIKRPGVYRVSLTLLGDGPEDDRQEVRAFAYNVDSVSEGDLKRASRDRLEPEMPPGDTKQGKLMLRVPGDSWDQFKERQPDASESSLLYLFFILILVVEQAMAVHLSFHTRSEQAPSAAPTRATAAQAA